MLDFARELPGFETQTRKGDPAGVNAVAGGLFQMAECVVDQQCSASLQLGFQVWPQDIGWFRPPCLVNHHVFDRDDCMQMPIQAQFLAQGHSVGPRCIGQHDAYTIQCPKTVWHTAMTGTQGFQVRKLVCIGQKVVRVGLVMAHHAKQSGAIAQPVTGSQLAGLLMVQLEVIREISGHLTIDLGQNVGGCMVQGIVQIQQKNLARQTRVGTTNITNAQNE